jgi:hypothetical protein
MDYSHDYHDGVVRLGIYLVRTAAYISAVELGKPCFDPLRLPSVLGDDLLAKVLNIRHQKNGYSTKDSRMVLRWLKREEMITEFGATSLPGLAISLSDAYPHASALIANIISGSDMIDYSSLALPPI